MNAGNSYPISYLGVVGQGDRANLNLQRCPNSAEMTGIVRHEGRIKDNGMGGNHDIVGSDITSCALWSGPKPSVYGGGVRWPVQNLYRPEKGLGGQLAPKPKILPGVTE